MESPDQEPKTEHPAVTLLKQFLERGEDIDTLVIGATLKSGTPIVRWTTPVNAGALANIGKVFEVRLNKVYEQALFNQQPKGSSPTHPTTAPIRRPPELMPRMAPRPVRRAVQKELRKRQKKGRHG